MKILYNKIKETILDTFYPKFCVECKKHGEQVCFDCVNSIYRIKTNTCFYCGRISKQSKHCITCRSDNKDKLRGILVATRFDEGPTKEMIHYLKYNGYFEFADLLGELMVERIVRSGIPFEDYIVVPVPMHTSRIGERGYNHAELMARYISHRLGYKGGLVLERVTNTVRQIGLSREKRLKNIVGKIRCEDKALIKDKNVLLVDDVATTGSTLKECANVLKADGAKSVWTVVVAKR